VIEISVSIFLILIQLAAIGQIDSANTAENKPQKDSVQQSVAVIDTAQIRLFQLKRREADSLRNDSIQKAAIKILLSQPDTVTYQKYYQHPWLALNKPAIFQIILNEIGRVKM